MTLVYALFAGALLFCLAGGKNIFQTAEIFARGVFDLSTLQLMGVITLIEILTVFLELTGSLQRILNGLRRVFADSRVLIALVPTLLGLFPVPGGAMLSAPMVGVYGNEIGIPPDRKSAINLFFRHIWDQVFPFKPHLILAAAVLKIPLFTLVGWHLPVTLASAGVGYAYLIAGYPRPSPAPREPKSPAGGRPLWVEAMPLLLPLGIGLGLRIDFFFATAIGLLFGFLTQPVSRGLIAGAVRKGIRPRLLLLIAAVMVFKAALESSGFLKLLSQALPHLGIPLSFLALALPLLVSAATGVELVAVGMVYPLLVGLVPEGSPVLPYVLIMMTANAVGQTHSPVHICMVVGNEYFGARLGRVLRMSVVPQGFRLAAVFLFAWLLGWLLSP